MNYGDKLCYIIIEVISSKIGVFYFVFHLLNFMQTENSKLFKFY